VPANGFLKFVFMMILLVLGDGEQRWADCFCIYFAPS